VAKEDVVDRAAIGDDVARKLPLAAQNIAEQHVAATRRLAVDAVVCTHERVRATFANAHLEVGQIALAQVTLAHDGVERVALWLRSAVDGEVFHGRDGLEVLRVVALQPADELDRQLTRQKRIFAVRLLSASPAGIPEDVDVRRPEREALISAEAPVPHVLVMLGARLVGDDGRHAEDEAVVPRGREADGLREHGREPGAGDAVQRLVPPIVRRNAESFDRRRDVLHLLDFFLQREARYEIGGALLERE
jgi:hypothetical protein